MLPTDLPLLRSCGRPSLLPDGRAAVVAVSAPDLDSDRSQGRLWWVPLDGDGPPRPLTHGHDDSSPVCSPDGRWVAFCRSVDGAPSQPYLMPLDGGEPWRVASAPSAVTAPRFSPDGTGLAYLARDPQDGRYVADAAAEAPRLISTLQYRNDNLGYFRDRPRRLWVVELPDDGVEASARPVTDVDLEVGAFEWWPDSRHLVAVAARHAAQELDLRRDAVLVDRTGSVPVPLTDAD
ncbi:MAG: S9 family peptidase, partial [Actinobacteria bacterium]|nr:S9 family peptidase [Actinomycetota bacterium]